jgi:C4-dicarboxylate-binding protein DctP
MKKLSLCVLAFALVATMQAFGAEYSIKLGYTPGNIPAADSPDIMYAEVFKKEVEANSKGAIEVTLYPSGQLGSAAESIQGVMGGYIDMTIVDMALLNTIYAPSQLPAAPGLFASEAECDAILAGDWGNRFRAEFEKATGIHMLNMHAKGFRNFTTSNKELRTVDTAVGVTFRVQESQLMIRMVEALGAKAVPMPGSEMYMAMRNGVVDGQENPVLNIIQDKTYEVQKYLVLDGHSAGIMCYIVNGKLFASLSDELKKAMDDAAAKAMAAAVKVVETKNREGVQILRDNGMTVYEPTAAELKEWHGTIFAPTQEYVRGELGNEIVDDLLQALKKQRGE